MARCKKLLNRPLPRQHGTRVGSLARDILFSVYQLVAEAEAEQAETKAMLRRQCDEMKMFWRSRPLTELRYETGATVTLLSGKTYLVLQHELRECRDLRTFYSHVRELLNLEKRTLLRLRFVGIRAAIRCMATNGGAMSIDGERNVEEHEVSCSFAKCLPYLKGSILQAVVHP